MVEVRRVRFEYPDDFDPRWNKVLPEVSCVANAVSLIMPFAEPYVVRSVRAALPSLEGELADVALRYARQEAAHHGQHNQLNAVLRRHYRGVAALESWMRITYGWLSRRRSMRLHLGFAAGFEAVAFALARWVDPRATTLFGDGDPHASSLFLWHLAEEAEHRSVAFDVHRAMGGTRVTYLGGMILAFFLLGWFTFLGGMLFLAQEGRLWRPTTWWRLIGWTLSFQFQAGGLVVVAALPGHHPDDLKDPPNLSNWLARYEPATASLAAWEQS